MAAALVLLPAAALAQPPQPSPPAKPKPTRPEIMSQRWEEDWSVLRDPAVPRQPLDALKYIRLAPDPEVYLSLGANLRERVETLDAPQFGVGHQPSEAYLLDRFEVDADLHVDGWEAFVQLEDDRAVGKAVDGPADADRLDLEQAFVADVQNLGGGVLKLRLGRQEFGFDLQRFVSDRDGPNVRQAYDAMWGDYEIGDWRVISFVSHPVQYQNLAVFDDYSNGTVVLDGFRVERRSLGPGNLAAYYLRYERDDAHFALASGDEQRNAFDVHYSGTAGAIDFDVEAMGQQGQIGGRPPLAWALGERSGVTVAGALWQPHLSLQYDAASGTTSAKGTFGTFNPLFPNGSYFTLASLTWRREPRPPQTDPGTQPEPDAAVPGGHRLTVARDDRGRHLYLSGSGHPGHCRARRVVDWRLPAARRNQGDQRKRHALRRVRALCGGRCDPRSRRP